MIALSWDRIFDPLLATQCVTVVDSSGTFVFGGASLGDLSAALRERCVLSTDMKTVDFVIRHDLDCTKCDAPLLSPRRPPKRRRESARDARRSARDADDDPFAAVDDDSLFGDVERRIRLARSGVRDDDEAQNTQARALDGDDDDARRERDVLASSARPRRARARADDGDIPSATSQALLARALIARVRDVVRAHAANVERDVVDDIERAFVDGMSRANAKGRDIKGDATV